MAKRLGELLVGTDVAKTDKVLVQQSSVDKQVLVSEWPVPFNYIAGLITSNDVSDLDHDIAIAPGVARSGDDSTNMTLAAILTKQIDAAWAVGDDAGGLDTGSVAVNTLYAVWLIKRPDTGVVDALFSTSFTSPTLPANYSNLRLIGAVWTDSSSNIYAYIQSGDYFRYLGAPNEVTDASITDETFETATLHVPPSCLAHIYGALSNTTSTAGVDGKLWIRTNGASETTGDTTPFLLVQTASNFDKLGASGVTLVDDSSQVEYAAAETTGAASVFINTIGFTMLTRSNP